MRPLRNHGVSSALAAAAGLAIVVLVAWHILNQNSERAVSMENVTLIAPPPPPETKPPDPVETPNEAPTPVESSEWTGNATDFAPASAASDGPLGLDASGESGSDAFGLVGRPGGRELALGMPAGGGGNPNGNLVRYAGELQSRVGEELGRHEEIRRSCYSVDLALRLDAAGWIEDIRIRKSTGDAALDANIRTALQKLQAMPAPPPGVPWPVHLRVVSRRPGCSP